MTALRRSAQSISDRAGNTTTLTQPVTVDNTAPRASLDDRAVRVTGPSRSPSPRANRRGSRNAGATVIQGSVTAAAAEPDRCTRDAGRPQTDVRAPRARRDKSATSRRPHAHDRRRQHPADRDTTPTRTGTTATVTVALSATDAESGVTSRQASSTGSTAARAAPAPRLSFPLPPTARTTASTPSLPRDEPRRRHLGDDKTATVKIDATAPNNVTLDLRRRRPPARNAASLAATAQDATPASPPPSSASLRPRSAQDPAPRAARQSRRPSTRRMRPTATTTYWVAASRRRGQRTLFRHPA